MPILNTDRTITLSNQKIFLMAKHIADKIMLATKTPTKKINYDMLHEIWYDYLSEELQNEVSDVG